MTISSSTGTGSEHSKATMSGSFISGYVQILSAEQASIPATIQKKTARLYIRIKEFCYGTTSQKAGIEAKISTPTPTIHDAKEPKQGLVRSSNILDVNHKTLSGLPSVNDEL